MPTPYNPIEIVKEHGSITAAARFLGMPRETLRNQVHRASPEGRFVTHAKSELKDAAGNVVRYWDKTRTARGEPEDFAEIPNGRITGTYTLYDNEGKVITQGVSRKPETQTKSDIADAVREFLAEQPAIVPPNGPDYFDGDVIPWFQIGDAHLGLLAHGAETGANFDLKIAEREICAAFSILFDECAPRERCVINDLGDFTHYENMAGVTEASHNALDYDGRFPKMIKVYARVMRFIVDKALEKFRIVDVIVNQGNHSRTNDIWMAVLLQEVYGATGRVNVLDNCGAFTPYRMGNTFVMIHHGDKTKPEKLRQVMASDYRQDWGEAEFRYIDVGHLHHKMAVKEDAGCTLEMWNTLAGRDKWHHDGGYRSQQSITRVDRSKTYGEVGRRVLPLKEIRAAIARANGEASRDDRRKVFTV